MRVALVPIGNRNALLKQIAAKRGLFNDALTEMARGAEKDFHDIWSDWQHQPQTQIVGTKNTIAIKITGANAKIFGFVNKGTRSHMIPKTPKTRRGDVLKYRKGYQPKTRPNNTKFKGSGVATGAWRSRKQVRHPGTKPRNFTRIISNRWRIEGRKILRAKLGVARLPR